MKRDDVREKIIPHLPFLKERYHVRRLGIFGSVARGEETPGSDVDILAEFDAPISLFTFVELENYLSDTVGCKVDLVSREALKPVIREEILAETAYV